MKEGAQLLTSIEPVSLNPTLCIAETDMEGKITKIEGTLKQVTEEGEAGNSAGVLGCLSLHIIRVRVAGRERFRAGARYGQKAKEVGFNGRWGHRCYWGGESTGSGVGVS